MSGGRDVLDWFLLNQVPSNRIHNVMRVTKPTLLLVLFVLIFATIACKKRTAAIDSSIGKVMPVAEEKSESGWSVYRMPEEGFSLELPPKWRNIEMNPVTLDAKLKELSDKEPQLESLAPNLREQAKSGIKFYGLDFTGMKNGFTTNVTVLHITLPTRTTMDAGVEEALRGLETLNIVSESINHERMEIGGLECERFRYKMILWIPGLQDRTVALTQLLFLKGTDDYTLTFMTLPELEKKYSSIFEKIGQSFRVTK
jgi:hypothetical protein